MNAATSPTAALASARRSAGRSLRAAVRGGASAFTLIEVLLAVALVGLVMVGLNTFVFSMGELWGRNRDLRLFDQHVRAVTRYLDRELRQASLPPAVGTGSRAIEAREMRIEFGRTADLVVFGLREGSRVLAWPERPLPEVLAAIEVRANTGLVLYWHSALEERFEQDPPREMVLTPLATTLAYDYYDTDFKRWETVPNLRKDRDGQLETPARLRLTFRYRNLTRESLIALPVTGEGLPPF